ncbi:NUDIX domain-containing protein [Streptomyces peucetius]|uniref:Nudix hydrolase domain-containing protein n=1 Tax=Streptomyces peucetius TaxID=1950 RepID=A0ABY6I1Q7_STRPE|nr:NUDIX domain-containing protein [Streptomyces peucetius]UYQ60911.1 hypothetical protein OGH68_05110 [Streptomyces peucetius]
MWSLLGGGREPQDPTLEHTVRRELAEEAPPRHRRPDPVRHRVRLQPRRRDRAHRHLRGSLDRQPPANSTSRKG